MTILPTMKSLRILLIVITFLLVVVAGNTQSPIFSSRNAYDPQKNTIGRAQYDFIYNQLYAREIGWGKISSFGIEVRSRNKQYNKVYLFGDYIKSYTLEKKTYLYLAYIEMDPDASGNKKEQLRLFFSNHNIREKQRWANDTRTANEKEIVADIDNKPIIVAETQPDVFLEVERYYEGDSGPKVKAFGTTTYIYDVNSLHPNNSPVIIGKLFQYKPELLRKNIYESAKLVNYNPNGIVSGSIDYITKEGGEVLPMFRIEKLDENGKLKEVNFNDIIGMYMDSGKVYFKGGLGIPVGVKEKWPAAIRDLKTDLNLLEEINQKLTREPVENKEQLREFFVNFNKLDEYELIDESRKTVFGKPVKYIYKGTFNKEGVPHGWGIMYAANTDDEYFLGQFTNGMPDGLGIRNYFKLDKPEEIYSSRGLHVGNQLVYGTKFTPVVNGNGSYATHGDFRLGELNGTGIRIWSRSDGVGDVTVGSFKDGRLHGAGSVYDNNKSLVGIFEKGSFVSGNSITDKIYDDRYYPGVVVLYRGKKYVIMKKENGMFLLDDGSSVSTKADLTLTGERSLRAKACLICNGTGYLKPTTNTVFSGVTKTEKTYQTGPTGYIVWEKTTKSTTAPVTTSRTSRCTACAGGLAGNEPVPLGTNKR